jgi:hypothetical protein
MHRHNPDQLNDARYARLRSFCGDGTPVDTPVWFAMDGQQLVFRTKVGPKTRRLATRGDVELAACDYRGRVRKGTATLAGRAAIAHCTGGMAGGGTSCRWSRSRESPTSTATSASVRNSGGHVIASSGPTASSSGWS